MPDAPQPAPFEAYVGDEPYLFASYAHVDGAAVFPELTYLRYQGYRVWYDEGIDPGNEWPEEVAKALAGASFFLVFISPNAVESQNVRNEIHYALNNHKPFLAIHLVETQLQPGLALRMGDIQAIMKWRMSDENYRRKVERALPSDLAPAGNEDEVTRCLRRCLLESVAWRAGSLHLQKAWTGKTNLIALIKANVSAENEAELGQGGWWFPGNSRIWSTEGTDDECRRIARDLINANRLLTGDPSCRCMEADPLEPDENGLWWKGHGDFADWTVPNSFRGLEVECVQCGYKAVYHPHRGHHPHDACPRCGLTSCRKSTQAKDSQPWFMDQGYTMEGVPGGAPDRRIECPYCGARRDISSDETSHPVYTFPEFCVFCGYPWPWSTTAAE